MSKLAKPTSSVWSQPVPWTPKAMVDLMDVHAKSSLDGPLVLFLSVILIATPCVVLKPRPGKLATPLVEAGVAVAVVAVLVAEVVVVEEAVEVADLEMEAIPGEVVIQLWYHNLW